MNIFKWSICQFNGHNFQKHYSGMCKDGYTCEHCGVTEYRNIKRENCPAIGKPCEFYSYQCDINGEMVINYCCHKSNDDKFEGNCSKEKCPLLKQ